VLAASDHSSNENFSHSQGWRNIVLGKKPSILLLYYAWTWAVGGIF